MKTLEFEHQWEEPDVVKYMILSGKLQSMFIPQYLKIEKTDSFGNFYIEKYKQIDTTLFPYNENWDKHKLLNDPRIKEILKWITKNVFEYMYNNVGTSTITTTDVRIRIAINKINTLPFIFKAAKLQWIDWICAVYHARLRIVMGYYLQFIVKLPF